MRLVNDFKEYQILDMAHGEKLESWNGIILRRPDPQIIWPEETHPELWNKASATYHRSNTGGGYWEENKNVPKVFEVKYLDTTFRLKLMGFKHTGLFPEQATNWVKVSNIIKNSKRPLKVLNLFAYTGAASVVALKAGASVVHVDSSRGMVDWAKENVKSSNLEDKPVRFLVDDVVKFVKREIRRGNKYDAIIMDPPSYGRGSNNEVWDIEKDLYNLVELCTEILSDDPLFFIINSYTAHLSGIVMENILKLTVGSIYTGKIYYEELGIESKNGLVLPCGVCARYEK